MRLHSMEQTAGVGSWTQGDVSQHRLRGDLASGQMHANGDLEKHAQQLHQEQEHGPLLAAACRGGAGTMTSSSGARAETDAERK